MVIHIVYLLHIVGAVITPDDDLLMYVLIYVDFGSACEELRFFLRTKNGILTINSESQQTCSSYLGMKHG